MAIDILKALIKKGESDIIKQIFNSTIKKWQNKILKGLQEVNENEILGILS